MTRLQLRLLGGFEAQWASGAALAVPTQKAQVLVAYLALRSGETHSREKLMGLLWSTRSDEQARNSLRQALSALKKSLSAANPSPLRVDRQSVALDRELIDVDTVALERSVAGGTPEDLARAATLYRGDFLEGITVRDPAGDEWLFNERERLRRLAIDALARLLIHQATHDRGEHAVATAQQLLRLDPFQEPAYRVLMRVHAEQGQRGLALKAYETCREFLERELEITPDAETEALYQAIRDEKIHPPRREPDAKNDHRAEMKASSLPSKPSIVVLPFTNISGDPEQQYFADGITENIITGLTRFRSLFVIAVKTAFAARDRSADVQQLARELGVAHVVEGSVRKAADRVRVTAQLIDAASGQRLWAENYDRDLKDIFVVQDEITNIIVATLVGRIEKADRHRAEHKAAKDMAAYDYWLRGRQCLNRYTKEGELEARQHLERALELDPEYAAAYAGLAVSYMHEYYASWSEAPHEALDRAYEFSKKAVDLDDADSAARYALAEAYFARNQPELAKIQIEKALALNPNDYHNLCGKGWYLSFSGELVEGMACLNEAMRLNPFTPDNCLFAIGIAEFAARRYEAAVGAFGKMTTWGLLKPAFLAACYAQLGRDEQARAAAAEVLESAKTELAIPLGEDPERWRAYWARAFPFQNPDDLEHLLDGLRKAGLPA